MFKTVACIASLLVMPVTMTCASADVSKVMHIDNGRMRAEFLLDFKPPTGWQQDTAATFKNGLPIYVPAGSDFGRAAALMYIRVSFNSDHRTPKSFIRVAHERWRAAVRDVKIDQAPSEHRSNGRADFDVYRFYNPGKPQQAYELMAYGDDTDKDGNSYFLMMGLTAASEAAIAKAEPEFRAALRSH